MLRAQIDGKWALDLHFILLLIPFYMLILGAAPHEGLLTHHSQQHDPDEVQIKGTRVEV